MLTVKLRFFKYVKIYRCTPGYLFSILQSHTKFNMCGAAVAPLHFLPHLEMVPRASTVISNNSAIEPLSSLWFDVYTQGFAM